MRDAGIGRALVASLHQGIADLMPSRLEFYESWLNSEGLRHGTIGLAPLKAVLSFLRQEGDAYALVTVRAGECAGDWLLAGRRLPRNPIIRRLPSGLRTRMALGTAKRLVRACYRDNRAAVRVQAGAAALEIQGSVFCDVREPLGAPLCAFYEALTARVLRAYGLESTVRATECRATGSALCRLSISPPAADPPAQRANEQENVP